MTSTRVLVVFYSMTGNVARLARAIAEGAKEVEGVEVRLRQVEELLPQEVVEGDERIKRTKQELADIPFATSDDLVWAHGIAFGSPTRFGNVSAQLKQFIDKQGGLFAKNLLENKVAGFFTSSNTQHGGQESTILTAMVPAFHFGMIVVGVPYSEALLSSSEIGGGGPYGPSSISGPGAKRRPDERELAIARTLGHRIATIAQAVKGLQPKTEQQP
jgi:NAD(P)H dehydrogenase (quinone)